MAAWWWCYEVLCDQDKSKKAAEGAERRGLEPALEDGAAAHSVDLGPTKSTVLRDTVLEWKGERVGALCAQRQPARKRLKRSEQKDGFHGTPLVGERRPADQVSLFEGGPIPVLIIIIVGP